MPEQNGLPPGARVALWPGPTDAAIATGRGRHSPANTREIGRGSFRLFAQVASEPLERRGSVTVCMTTADHIRRASHACCRPTSRCSGQYPRLHSAADAGVGNERADHRHPWPLFRAVGSGTVPGLMDRPGFASSAMKQSRPSTSCFSRALSARPVCWPLLACVSPLGCVRFRPGTVTDQPRLRRRERLLRSGPRHARHARARPARGCACLRSSLRRG